MKVVIPYSAFGRYIEGSTNVAADSAPVYDPATTYNTGDVVLVKATHTIYKCLVDSYTDDTGTHSIVGHYPPSWTISTENKTFPWMELRADNQTACMDDFLNTQTVGDIAVDSGAIKYRFSAGGCDTVALFNIEATSVTISLYDGDGITLISTEEVPTFVYAQSAEEVFFSQPQFKTNVISNFSKNIGCILEVIIHNTLGAAKCGMICLGQEKYIGSTQNEVSLPITDYSVVKTDSLGRVYLSKGLVADVADFTLYAETITFSYLRDLLKGYRATWLVWCLDNTDKISDADSALLLFARYTDLKPVFRKPGKPTIQITLAGGV